MSADDDHFADNLRRLAGMHDLLLKDVAALIGASESVVNKWQSGDRKPSFTYALKVGDLFEVDPGALVRLDFDELLETQLTPKKYRQAEQNIERLKREWSAPAEKKVVSMRGKKQKRR
jgi:transcriptional regulator with XRE-family HTH domain